MFRRIYIMYTHVGYNIFIGYIIISALLRSQLLTDFLQILLNHSFLKKVVVKRVRYYTSPFWKSLPQTVRSIFERIPLWDMEKQNFTKMLMLIIFVILYTVAQFVSIMYTLHIHKETRFWLDTACCLAWITIYLLPYLSPF